MEFVDQQFRYSNLRGGNCVLDEGTQTSGDEVQHKSLCPLGIQVFLHLP